MSKSPEMESFLNEFTMSTFGRKRSGNCCVICGSMNVQPENFRDELSIKEFNISRMCQNCQDSVFGEFEE